MCNERLVTILVPIGLDDNVIEVTYRPDFMSEQVKDVQLIEDDAEKRVYFTDVFCSIVHSWGVTEQLHTRLGKRVVATTVPVVVTKRRLLLPPKGAQPIPGFLLVYVLRAVVHDWIGSQIDRSIVNAIDGATGTAEENTNG